VQISVTWVHPPGAALLRPIAAGAEFVLAFTLLVLALPVLMLAAALVKLTSMGPILYRQTRVGQGGRVYQVVKLRTMYVGSEQNGACWSVPGDPRVTPVGRVLRRLHLDELPQLWNVLRGEMRLVGPRPERPEFVADLAEVVPHYGERLGVRPGITGLAQVQRASDTDLSCVRWKTAYDLWHVRKRSLGLDMRILVGTALKLCGVSFATIRLLLRFPEPAVVMSAYEELCSRNARIDAGHRPAGAHAVWLQKAGADSTDGSSSLPNHPTSRGQSASAIEQNGYTKEGLTPAHSRRRHDGPNPVQPPHLHRVEAQRS
jgi:lipopolysaccharide/colanic/teichoic acid biosynthesis glycosyltransferase